jgi:hypothetical protein
MKINPNKITRVSTVQHNINFDALKCPKCNETLRTMVLNIPNKFDGVFCKACFLKDVLIPNKDWLIKNNLKKPKHPDLSADWDMGRA